jgi:hypothetical protein
MLKVVIVIILLFVKIVINIKQHMKTAMQELIDEMTVYLDLHESPEVKEVLKILKASAIRKYWKKEKEQIIDAYDKGSDVNDDLKPLYGTPEEYYNETYNQNK